MTNYEMKNLDIKNLNDVVIEAIEDNNLYEPEYPKALAEFIKECEPPITIAIQGEWGSGKTSMMNIVKKELGINNNEISKNGQLEEGDNVLFISFNAWLFSQFNLGDQLSLTLLEHIINCVDEKNDMLKTIKNFSIIVLNSIGKKAGANSDVTDAFEKSNIEVLNKLKSEFEKAVDKKLNEKKKNRLVIFIDDIDRVEPAKAVELLEAIKIFCECKNCVFVLAVDYDIILKGAKRKFDDDKGQEFFDKIIQVPFNMPVTTSKTSEYIKNLIGDVFSNVSEEKLKDELTDFYINMSKVTKGNNPRSIKRLLNSFVITDKVLRLKNNNEKIYPDDEKSEYVRALLYGLLCIEYNNSKVYEYILNEYNEKEEKEEKENVDELINNINKIIKNNDKSDGGIDVFYDYIGDENQEYNTDILDCFVKILEKVNKLKGIDFNKLFSISKTGTIQRSDTKNERDTTQFILNGDGPYGKGRLANEIITKAKENCNTYNELNNKLNGYLDKYSIFTCDENKIRDNKGKRRYFDSPLVLGEEKYYITNQWGANKKFDDLLKVAQDLGYNIEKCEE